MWLLVTVLMHVPVNAGIVLKNLLVTFSHTRRKHPIHILILAYRSFRILTNPSPWVEVYMKLDNMTNMLENCWIWDSANEHTGKQVFTLLPPCPHWLWSADRMLFTYLSFNIPAYTGSAWHSVGGFPRLYLIKTDYMKFFAWSNPNRILHSNHWI